MSAKTPYIKGGPVRLSFGPPLTFGRDEEIADFQTRLRKALQAQMRLDEPLPPLRRNLKFRFCQCLLVPFTWTVFKIADLLRPSGRR